MAGLRIPGNPDGPESPEEFAWWGEIILGYVLNDCTGFFADLEFLAPVKGAAENAIERLIARRVLERNGSALRQAGNCPRCAMRMLNGFARGLATQFQVAFLRAWEDLSERAKMKNQLVGYVMRHPVAGLDWKTVVVNVRKRDNSVLKCVIHRREAARAY